MNKAELINTLVEEYGYEKEDLKDSEGKPFTNAKLKQMIDSEEQDLKNLESNKNRVSASRKSIKEDDLIFVMSGSEETVIYNSKRTGRVWEFNKFGQEDSIPYSEIRIMNNQHPTYFKNGILVILDEQVQKDFGLTDMYKNILTPSNIDTIFEKSPEELGNFIDKLPEGMKKTLVDRAMKLYSQDKLTDLLVVRVIEDKYGFSLEDNTPKDDLVITGDVGENKIIYVDNR